MKNINIYILIFLVLIFSLALRVPNTDDIKLKGIDTYTNYKLSNSIQQKNYIPWVLNPLSLTGYYPLSYQTGGVLFISLLSSIINLDYILTVYIWNSIMIIIIGLLMYNILIEIFLNKIVAIIGVLIYLNTRIIIYFSDGFFTVRNIFNIFLLLIIFLLLQDRINTYKRIILISIITIISSITHKMFIIIIPILIISYLSKKIPLKYFNKKYAPHILLFLIIGLFLATIIFLSIKSGPTVNVFITSKNILLNKIINSIQTYAINIGLLSIIFIFGLLAILLKKDKTRKDVLILMIFIMFIPLLQEKTYTLYASIPIIIIIMSYFINNIIHLKNNSTAYTKVIIIIIIAGIIIPMHVTIIPKTNDYSDLNDRTIHLTRFLLYNNINKTILCNYYPYYCNQITAISNNKIISLSQYNNIMFAERYNLQDLKLNVRPRNIFSFKDPVLKTSYYDEIYESYFIKYSSIIIQDQSIKQSINNVITFTNLGYIIDSNEENAINNQNRIIKKFGNLNKIYDNGLEQIKPLD